MSKLCRICGEEMPKDRKGADQVCPKCRKRGEKELWEGEMKKKTYSRTIEVTITSLSKKILTEAYWMCHKLIGCLATSQTGVNIYEDRTAEEVKHDT